MRINIKDIIPNPANPRVIRDEQFRKLKQSLAQFPQMLEKRPIAVTKEGGKYIALGGNQRLRALLDLQKETEEKWFQQTYYITVIEEEILVGYFAAGIPVVDCTELTPMQQKRFIIADNVPFGEWDWEGLANEWDVEELADWGLSVPGYDGVAIDPEELGEDFTLADGDKAPFQQMTFTLADEQAAVIKNAIEAVKKTDEYKYAETMGNENSNGNALYLIVAGWAGQKI